ncbi:imm11 family protein [Massilia glaciei]|nr:hypothetical protein [Massilia glaciei]
MPLLWRIPDKYPQKAIGAYDTTIPFDRFMLLEGQRIVLPEAKPVVHFSITAKQLLVYDCLPNSALVPLLSKRLIHALRELCEDDFQSIPTVVVATDMQLDDYSFLNATTCVPAIDHACSNYFMVPETEQIMGFRKLRHRPNCLGERHLARDVEYRSHLLASEKVLGLLRRLKAKGAELLTAEEVHW